MNGHFRGQHVGILRRVHDEVEEHMKLLSQQIWSTFQDGQSRQETRGHSAPGCALRGGTTRSSRS
jgi:hypothetical protein